MFGFWWWDVDTKKPTHRRGHMGFLWWGWWSAAMPLARSQEPECWRRNRRWFAGWWPSAIRVCHEAPGAAVHPWDESSESCGA